MHTQSLSRVQLFVTLWTIARQSPLSMGFSRQEYWSGLPISPSGDLPDPGVKSDWQADSLPLIHQVRSVSQSVQSLNCVQLFGTPWTAACTSSLSFTNYWSLLKLMSIELVMSFNPLILCRSPSPPAFNLSQDQGLFQ